MASIQIPVFISYYPPAQGRMADATTSTYEFDRVVRGKHVYTSGWIMIH